MTDNYFVDTNILVYLFDQSEVEKNKRAEEFVKKAKESSNLFISAQVLNEFITIVTRKIENPIAFENIKEVLAFIRDGFTISPLKVSDSFSAVEIKLRYKFSYWDCLIVASALSNGCTRLYSEDLQHGQLIDEKLRVINPLK